MANRETARFSVLCVKKYPQKEQHVLRDQTFDQICEEIVVPYLQGDVFYVGGVRMKQRDLFRFQIFYRDRSVVVLGTSSSGESGNDVTNAITRICKKHVKESRLFWRKPKDPYASAFSAFDAEFPEPSEEPLRRLDKPRYSPQPPD